MVRLDETVSAPPSEPAPAHDQPEASFAAGALVTSKYEIVRTIGSGGMGVVYEAINLQTHARVAIKMLRGRARTSSSAFARFAREARAAGTLRSPHVARVIDADTSNEGVPFIVFEHYEGCDLQTELHQRGGTLSVALACGYIVQACAGLAEAHHKGIIHRDLKPSNLFLAREGAERRIRILDFGVSKNLAATDDLTESMASIGTASYMAPEQVRDAKTVDHRADVWALGIILYKLLTGATPFRGPATAVAVAIATEAPKPPSSVVATIPAALDAVILRALHKDPGQRTPSVAVLARELASFADADLTRAALAEIALHEAEPIEAAAAPLPVRRRGLVAVVIGVLALIVLAVVLIRRPATPPAEPTSQPEPSATPSPVAVVSPTTVASTTSSTPIVASTAAPVTKKAPINPKGKPKPKRVEDPDLLP